jgi:hypothetical protein
VILNGAPSRRLYACRLAGDMQQIIGDLPDSKMKLELTNMVNLALRMFLIENDGAELSPSRLNAF